MATPWLLRLWASFVVCLLFSPVALADQPWFSASPTELLARTTAYVHRTLVFHLSTAHHILRDIQTAVRGLPFTPSEPKSLVKRSTQQAQCRLNVFPAGPPRTHDPSGTSPPRSRPTSPSAPSPIAGNSTGSSNFHIVHAYSGNDFFDQWDFWEGGDPTHGTVDYQSLEDAQKEGLAAINDAGNLVMKVDTTPQVTGGRKSVRITTQISFNGGLLIMDALHIPTGCGTWPAFWTNGPNWPLEGEIDIVEGVNDYTDNQATVHTGHGCTLPPSSSTPSAFSQFASGQLVGGTNCAAFETANQGCGVRFLDPNSFGPGFNANGGGVYAMLWDETGIAVFFFPRQSIPSDIASGNPNPSAWGLPNAKWPSSNCNPFQFFKDHVAIFDTTLCGDWAGVVWSGSGLPGQEQSCAQRTGESSCETFVLNNGGSFNEAYWEVSYVKLYQSS